jgi:hypothetical protein
MSKMTTIGVLHPGEMGAAVGAALVSTGHEVIWASAGRSQQSQERAREAGLRDVVRVEALIAESEMALSICGPDAALHALHNEWELSQTGLRDGLTAARREADAKGRRWEGEMRQIAVTFLAAGQPAGFHQAAPEVFSRASTSKQR